MKSELQIPDERVNVPCDYRDISERSQSVTAVIVNAIRASYHPRALSPPEIDPELAHLSAIPRIAEVCRYSIAKLEYSLSSQGRLRAWLKLNLLIALLIAAPAVLVLPFITLVLGTFATWSDYLAAITMNLLWTTFAIIGTAAAFTFGLFVLRFLWPGSNR
jgi:hypothetical protein